MIVSPRDTRYSPDIKVINENITADMLTGDGVFADTDLVRIPYDGYLIVNAVCNASGGAFTNLIYIPQIHHQENRSSDVPTLNGGTMPDVLHMVNYKIPVHKGDTPRVLYDEGDATIATIAGYFYRGMNRKAINNPVAYNTPDVTVVCQSTATHQNILEGTDLEDFPMPGVLLIWAGSDTVSNTIQIMQKGHQTGNTSDIPIFASGFAADCSNPPYKMYVPATGNPTVTITNAVPATNVVTVVASLYVDWANVSPSLRSRMGY